MGSSFNGVLCQMLSLTPGKYLERYVTIILEITKLITRGENLNKSNQFAIDLSEDNKIIKEMDATFIEIMIENEREYADCDKEVEEVEKVCEGKNYLTNVECSLLAIRSRVESM